MKKILNLTLIALLGMVISASAQDTLKKTRYVIAKGTKMFTGRLNVGYFSAPGNRSINFGIGEQNGFFVANNLSIGTVVNYDFRYSRDFVYIDPSGETGKRVQTIHSPAIGFALRYYKMFTPRFGFFGEFVPTVGVNISNEKITGVNFPTNQTSRSINLDISITPNLVYFVTNKFAIEAGFGRLGYSYTFGSPSHSASLGVTPRLNLGMSFYLGKGVQPKN